MTEKNGTGARAMRVTYEQHASPYSIDFAIRTIPFAYRLKEREDLLPWYEPLGEMEMSIQGWLTGKHIAAILSLAIRRGRIAMMFLSDVMSGVADQAKRAGATVEELRHVLSILYTGPAPFGGRNERGIQDGLGRILDSAGNYMTFEEADGRVSFVDLLGPRSSLINTEAEARSLAKYAMRELWNRK